MNAAAEKLAQKALELSTADRAQLVEKLLQSLAGGTDPLVERANLDEVHRRREEGRTGNASFVDGDEALRRARAALRQ